MKIAPPTLPASLEPVDDLKNTLRKSDLLEGMFATNQDMSDLHFETARLVECRLQTINFLQTRFDDLSVNDAVLHDCSLTAASLAGSEWNYVQLTKCPCGGVQFQSSALRYVVFDDCKLDLSNFRNAKLTNVLFQNCSLNDIDFYGAVLSDVEFAQCQIGKIQFSTAKLTKVNLTTSEVGVIEGVPSLKGAEISSAQLITLAPQFAQALGIKVKK